MSERGHLSTHQPEGQYRVAAPNGFVDPFLPRQNHSISDKDASHRWIPGILLADGEPVDGLPEIAIAPQDVTGLKAITGNIPLPPTGWEG